MYTSYSQGFRSGFSQDPALLALAPQFRSQAGQVHILRLAPREVHSMVKSRSTRRFTTSTGGHAGDALRSDHGELIYPANVNV